MITREWSKDTAVVFAIILLIPVFKNPSIYSVIALCLLLVALIIPQVLYPLGWIWFRFALILRFVGQTLAFSLVFFLVLFPMSVIKSLLAKKQAQLATAFISSEKAYSREDIIKPY